MIGDKSMRAGKSQSLFSFFRIYNLWILAAYFFGFLALLKTRISFIPDVFNLCLNIENSRIILTFAGSITGFFSLVLAIFIVYFNLFSASAKRYSIEFVLANRWIQTFISIYIGTLFFLVGSYLSINFPLSNNDLNLLYGSIILFSAFLILAFPLILKSLQYSVSLRQVQTIIKNISPKDISQLTERDFHSNNDFTTRYEEYESNRILQIKDLGVEAIHRKDWALPQNIVKELCKQLIKPIEIGVEIHEVEKRLKVIQFLLDHFMYPAYKGDDLFTIQSISKCLSDIHEELSDRHMSFTVFNPLIQTVNRLSRLVIDSPLFTDFFDIQEYATVHIHQDFKSFSANDAELQLVNYCTENQIVGNRNEEVNRKWRYLLNDSRSIFFEAIEYAIQKKNRKIYDGFDWKLRYHIELILGLENLTEYQKEVILQENYFSGGRLIRLLIDGSMYHNECIYSGFDIGLWVKENRRFAMRALNNFSYFIHEMHKEDALVPYLINEFMMTARTLTDGNKYNLKQEALDIITNTISEIYDSQTSKNSTVRDKIVEQIIWQNDIITSRGDLLSKKAFEGVVKKVSL